MRKQLSQPSFVNGFARSKGESVRPDLWPDHAWIPALGIQGATLWNLTGSGNGNYISGGWTPHGIQTNGTTDYALLGSLPGIGDLSIADSRVAVQQGLVIATRFKMSSYSACCVFGEGSSFTSTPVYALNIVANRDQFRSPSNGHLHFEFRQGSSAFGILADFGQVLELNKWHTFVCSVKMNGDWEDLSFYLDGVKQDPINRVNNYSGFQSFSLNNFCLGCMGVRDGGQAGYFPGEIAYLNIKKGWVPANVVQDFSNDPLLPFRRRAVQPYWVMSGEPPASNIPVIMNHRRLIGCA